MMIGISDKKYSPILILPILLLPRGHLMPLKQIEKDPDDDKSTSNYFPKLHYVNLQYCPNCLVVTECNSETEPYQKSLFKVRCVNPWNLP
jgi:hypothetical protein